MMKQLIIILLFFSIAFPSYSQINCSVSASPFPVSIKNGEDSLMIIGKGSRLLNWKETLDGYVLMKNKHGIYEYTITDATSNKLMLSGVRATNKPTTEKQHSSTSTGAFFKNNSKSTQEQISQQFKKKIVNLKQQAPYKAPPQFAPLMLPSATIPSTGDIKVLCILIEYPDLLAKEENNKAKFEKMFNEDNYDGTGSFSQYYRNASNGMLNITVDVVGWYMSKNNYKYYSRDSSDHYKVNRGASLVREAVEASFLEEDIDFSDYDNNNNGVLDGVMIFHAGQGAEEGGLRQYIWSHRSSLWNLKHEGLTIEDYIINPELSYRKPRIGVVSHEFGHNLGLPDLYDTDYSSRGIGAWGLMGAGAWLNLSSSPSNLSAWSRIKLGWVTPKIIPMNIHKNYSLSPSYSYPNDIYKIISEENPLEYFLLENRQRSGLDSYLHGKGLAIWHIDDTKKTNSNDAQRLVDLEEADGENHLDDNRSNIGDGGDLYPGIFGKVSFSENSNPNSNLYSNDNERSALSISYIEENISDSTISFNVSYGVSLSEESLSFGSVTLNSMYAHNNIGTDTFTITNTGNSPLSVSKIQLPTGFSTGKWSSGEILAGNSQRVVIIFKPRLVKDYSGGLISVGTSTSSGISNLSISSGEGMLYTGLYPELENSPSRVLTVYPNPAMNFITIKAGAEEKINKVEIYTLTGKLIQSNSFNRKNTIKMLLEQTIADRIVLLKVYTKNSISINKLIIESSR